MTHSNPQVRESNDNSIVLIVDNQSVPLALPLLMHEDIRQQLRAFCTNARQIILCDWQCITVSPSEVSRFFLTLISESADKWRFRIGNLSQTYANPFEATLNTAIDRADLTLIGHATGVAIAAAATVCPGASSEAATRIREWLARNGIHGDGTRSIAAQIRRNCPAPDANEQLNPQDAARMVLDRMQTEREARGETEFANTPPVRYYLQDFYHWNGREWKLSPSFELVVVRILQDAVLSTDLTNNFIKSVITNLQGIVLLHPSDVRPPFWICDEERQQVHECPVLGFDNGIINLNQLQATGCEVQLAPHSPSLFGVPRLNYQFDATATCPLWMHTLREIMAAISPNDHRIDLLQEFFGYCLLSTNHRFEAFLILIGDGANGKSVILEVLSAMLGRNNVSNVPLDAFGAEFRNADMIGKLANIATDMQRMPRVQEGTLKQVVSGEPLQVNRKYKSPVSMYPTAKLIFATNHLPPFADTSNGLWRRMLVIPFFVQFAEDQIDRYRARRIITQELAGVLNWALAGARRLIQNDAFTRCEVCEMAKSGHRQDSDPFLQFLDECGLRGEGASVLCDDLYMAYRGFCDSSGKMPKAKSEFGKQIARLEGVTRRREYLASRRYYIYDGVGLLPTVLGSPQSDWRTRQYQPPYRQELAPRAGSRHAGELAASPGTPLDTSDPPHRGMNLGMT